MKEKIFEKVTELIGDRSLSLASPQTLSFNSSDNEKHCQNEKYSTEHKQDINNVL